MSLENVSNKLSDILVTRNFQPEYRDTQGKSVVSPDDAEMFSFNFVAQSGKDYGTVVIFLGEENALQVYYADNIGRAMDEKDKEDWFKFLEQLSLFSKRNRLSFDLRDINKLRYTMQGQAALNEGLFESWSGKKNVSYNNKENAVRLMIKHSKDIKEGEQRFRHIESIFVETEDGERFKLPFKSIAGGKAMCEHVRNGGRPYDVRGTHIADIIKEIAVLTRFGRAHPEKVLENEEIIKEATNHLSSLKETMRSLTTRRGYNDYFETWSPASIDDGDLVVEEVRGLLTTENLDTRIEEALPILSRLQGSNQSEADVFENWANDLLKGI